MASLSKTFVVVFVFLGTFSLLVGFIPSEFFTYQADYFPTSPTLQEKKVVDYFSAHDVLVYNVSFALDNTTNEFLTYGESQSFDFGLPEGHKIEFWWDLETGRKMFQIRHTKPGPFGWWTEFHRLNIDEAYRVLAGITAPKPLGLEKKHIENLWGIQDGNASYCEFHCDHISVKIFIIPYKEEKTIGESWDAGYLQIYTSYKIHWEQTGVNMFTVLTQLLLFQAPNLGISGVGGTILTSLIGFILWACIAILMFKIITSLIPFIPGWGD